MSDPTASAAPEPGPAAAINPGEPATPRPAASVILLRRGGKHSDRALEVLMPPLAIEADELRQLVAIVGEAIEAATAAAPADDARLAA